MVPCADCAQPPCIIQASPHSTPVQVALCRRSMMEAEAALSELRHEVAGLRTELALSERLRIAMACSVGFKQKGHTSNVHHALSG